MRHLLIYGALVALVGAVLGVSSQASAQGAGVTAVGNPHFDYGYLAGTKANGSSPLVTYHGGPVITSTAVYAIFWGTSWSSYTGDKISGMDTFYAGMNRSAYAGTADEYSGSNGQITSSVSYGGHFVDSSSAPGNPNTKAVVQEVANVAAQQHFPLVSNGFYAVYGDAKGPGGYCAWHSYGTVNGVTIQVAWMPNEDGVAGCDPQDSSTGHSEGLAEIADSTAHELSEARTDPTFSGWYDNGGQEVGDKCNFIYPGLVKLGTTYWKIQGEWSNAAYQAGTGYPNASGQKGCIIG